MPMDFPDMESLEHAAKVWKFRTINEGEDECEYRRALADHVQPMDLVESMEIRASNGWDKFSEKQNIEMLVRGMKK